MPVNGMPDYYNMSAAVGVSNDGTKVVGTLSPGAQYPGSPPPLAFVWTAGTGEIMLNTLAQQSGYNLSNLFGVDAISGSGDRIVALGAPPATVHERRRGDPRRQWPGIAARAVRDSYGRICSAPPSRAGCRCAATRGSDAPGR